MQFLEQLVSKFGIATRKTAAHLFRRKRLAVFRLRAIVLISVLLAATLSFMPKARVYAGSDDYPAVWKNAPMDSMFDSWGEYNRECTSFVAWRLSSQNGFPMPFYDDANMWGVDAQPTYKVDANPVKGSVAWSSAGAGHVAWVEATDGTTVTLEEYNEVDSNGNGIYGDDGTYDERAVPASMYQYIHFKDITTPNIPSPSAATGGPGIGVGNAVFLGTDHLVVNQTMRANQYITSANLQNVLIMQSDGNLVLYGPGYQAVWSSRTYGNPGAVAVLQSDGNLVVYSSGGTALWASYHFGSPQELIMQSDGNLVEYGSGIAMWYTATGRVDNSVYIGVDRLNPNTTLGPNQFLRSQDGRYVLLMQTDGNLVEYGPGYHAVWNAGTGGTAAAYAIMQSDGNLVLYTVNNVAVWHTHTYGNGSSFAVVQGDGNFVVYTTSGTATWNAGSAGKI